MTDDVLRCPRCSDPLAELTLGQVEVEGCGTCGGTLVEQKNLVRLLEILAAGFAELADPDAPIDVVDDTHAAAMCPDCDGPMAKHGYQGSKQVMLDRCNACALIWLDGGELDVMAQLYLRSERDFQSNVDRLQQLAEYLRPANYYGDVEEWSEFIGTRKPAGRSWTAHVVIELSTRNWYRR